MAVYFIRERPTELVKIGVSKDAPKRQRNLQTGNPRELELMGWITPQDGTDFALERHLHKKYATCNVAREWFAITSGHVLDELRHAHINGFVPKQADAFEIIERDKDAVPIYLGVCAWVDLEIDECCPFCGSFCGMHFQDASWMYHCLHCDELTDFEDIPR